MKSSTHTLEMRDCDADLIMCTRPYCLWSILLLLYCTIFHLILSSQLCCPQSSISHPSPTKQGFRVSFALPKICFKGRPEKPSELSK